VINRAFVDQVAARGITVRYNEPLASHTTFRIGGPSDAFAVVDEVPALIALVRLAQEYDVPYFLLGGGSNILVSDAGVRGLVIANRCQGVRTFEDDQGTELIAEAGASLAGTARWAVRAGLDGLTWAVSVPGTVGGAVVGNAGAYDGCIGDVLESVQVLMSDGSIVEMGVEALEYTYRGSVLKRLAGEGKLPPVVLCARFCLHRANMENLKARAAAYLAHRRRTQPTEPSIGSIFRNPPNDYAGRLVEAVGLKGYRVGEAGFSPLHANFIVNYGKAQARDVVSLIDLARRKVFQQFGIRLEPEILFVGQWSQWPPYALLSDAMAPTGVRETR